MPHSSPSHSDELFAAYHRYDAEKREVDFWAWAQVAEVARSRDGERAWEVIRTVVRTAPDERLAHVGAGPLEDFVETHGARFIDAIVREARDDARFRDALASMWLVREDFRPEILAQLQAATGDRIEVADQASVDAVQIEPLGREDTDDG